MNFREQETLLEQLVYLFNSKIRWPLERLLAQFKRIPQGLNNMYLFFGTVYYFRRYDFAGMYMLIIKSLELQEEFYLNKDNCMMQENRRKRILKNIQTCKTELTHIFKTDHGDNLRDELDKKYPHMTLWYPIENDCLLMKTIYREDGHKELHDKEVRNTWKIERRLHKRSWDRFLSAFRQSEMWWD